uniref:Uncharacterized protein n=1 Tax=Arundo donax TaxID=35708 RepID=A0A0A9EIK2_ARUDO
MIGNGVIQAIQSRSAPPLKPPC